ncbi:MAG: proton-conducting transporter membrane subunit, partial [Solirubrobacterales bacterium]
ALIHAATMVTAGVYLIARMHPLFELAPTAADIAAFGGLATLIVAATIALVVTDLKRIIAYSTMSQIGYMIVGVSIGAYTAGIFHLMTHAFFKALLFMAAGSVIGAMAGNQNIDRMSGFRRAMPFTSFALVIGGLALAGFPLMSGFFSKDEILVFAAERGGMYWIFAIGGYLAAFLTAFYAFRIGFRVVLGEPCKEAKELEQGHLAHSDHANPATGEKEDTEVGFPGSEHHIAERAPGMRIAMAILAALSIVAGFIQLPGVTAGMEHFLEGTFEESELFHIVPSEGSAYLGLLVGALMAFSGIGLAYFAYVARPGLTGRLRSRMEGVHDFLQHKWYFDEAIDFLVYRPVIRAGQFANNVIERVVVDGIVTATAGAVREMGLLVRGAQSGFVRAYALLVLGGFAALALYFLVVSS